MSIVARFTPKGLTVEQYEEAVRRLEEAGLFPAEAMDYHVCFGSEGNLRVSEIWDSREQLDAYMESLMPVLTEVGIEFSGEPEILEAHNIIKR
jgi:quinol monooxygenase YgiN